MNSANANMLSLAVSALLLATGAWSAPLEETLGARAAAAGSGVIAFSGDCAALAWDDNPVNYGNAAYIFANPTIEQAEKAALEACQEAKTESQCTIKASWCGAKKCVALSYSYDWQWYAYNPNPVLATKAAMHALNACTQNVCNAAASEETCSSGAPVCYIERILCGKEQTGLNFDAAFSTQIFTLDSIFTDPVLPSMLTASPSVLSTNLPLPAVPITAVDTAATSEDPAVNDPAYVAGSTDLCAGTTTANDGAAADGVTASDVTAAQ